MSENGKPDDRDDDTTGADTPATVGRPRKEQSAEELEWIRKLGSIYCSIAEISELMDIPKRTLERRIAEKTSDISIAYRAGLAMRRESYFRLLWRLARGGNVVALIWLGKQAFGMADRVEIGVKDRVKAYGKMSDEELLELAEGGDEAADAEDVQ